MTERIHWWINVYLSTDGLPFAGQICPTRNKADAVAEQDRIACIYVSFNKGDGLNVKALTARSRSEVPA